MARVPRKALGKSSLERGIQRYPNSLFLLSDQRLCIVKNCVYTHTNTHVPDSVQTIYVLPLLPNNTAVKRFYTNR